jgi:hypothetical protein
LHNLKTLTVHGIGEYTVSRLISDLPNIESFHADKVSPSVISDSAFQNLLMSPNLRSLSYSVISGNNFGFPVPVLDDAWRYIHTDSGNKRGHNGEPVSHLQKLEHLSLEDTSTKSLLIIAKMVETSKSIKTISILSGKFDDGVLCAFAKALRSNKTLKEI